MIQSLRQKIATLEDDNSRISKQLSENNAAFECTLAESDAQHDLEQEEAYTLYENLKS